MTLMLDPARWPAVAAKYPTTFVNEADGTIRTTVCRISWPALAKPKSYQDNPANAARYGVTLLFPTAESAAVIGDQCRAVLRGVHGGTATFGAPTPDVKEPIVPVIVNKRRIEAAWPLSDQGAHGGEGYEPGRPVLSAYSAADRAPKLFLREGGGRRDIKDPAEIGELFYAGAFALATIRVYHTPKWSRLAVGLQALQWIAGGPRLGGGGVDLDDVAVEVDGSDFQDAAELASLMD